MPEQSEYIPQYYEDVDLADDYLDGNTRAAARAEAIELMLEDFGIEPERFRLEWVSASEGQKFAKVMTEMTDLVKELGPSPYSQG